MKKSPLISIIIPVYNREKLVQETLVSVIAQTNENWECIVIDDGSTDKTWQGLETYSKKDDRIKPIKRYRGPKRANTCRNIGIENSEGEYLIFLAIETPVFMHKSNNLYKFLIKHKIHVFKIEQFENFIQNGLTEKDKLLMSKNIQILKLIFSDSEMKKKYSNLLTIN